MSARSFARDAWAVVDDFVGVSARRDVDESSERRDVDVVAYSYGTQIALEMIRARPRRVRAFISLLGTPERILDGLLPAWLANATMRTATRVLGERASAAVVGAALKLAATAPMAIWALSRATGSLGRPFRSTLVARSGSVERLGATRGDSDDSASDSERPSRSKWVDRGRSGRPARAGPPRILMR